MSTTTLRQPSFWLPILMSLAALSIVLCHLTLFGFAREADEGITAHLFQILMVGQLPVIAFFAIKGLSKNRAHALRILALQAGAGLLAAAPVFFLHL